MKVLRARVTKGKLVLEEPKTTLPEGTVVQLVLSEEQDDEHDIRGLEYAELRTALKRAEADFNADRGYTLEELIASRKVVTTEK